MKKKQEGTKKLLIQTPAGYELWANGVFALKKKLDEETLVALATDKKAHKPTIREIMPAWKSEFFERVTAGPLWISRIGRDIDPNVHAVYLRLAYGSRGQHFRWVNAGQIASKQKILALAMEGIPVDETCVMHTIRYLSACQRLVEDRRPVLMASRMGLHETSRGRGWLIGEDWIGPEGTRVYPAPSIAPARIQAFSQNGTFEEWWKRFKQLRDDAGPVARWLVYSMFASPLLAILDTRGFLIHHHGRTASGKTAILDFGMSVWGQVKSDPSMTGTFNATPMAMVAQFADVDSVPLCFDELQAANFKDRSQDIASLIMAMVLGKPRQRLSPSGELTTPNYSWRAIVRFTGEQALISEESKELEGVANRVLQLQAEAMTATQALQLHRWMERTKVCGVAGRAFLRKLLPWINSPKRLQRLKRLQQRVLDHLESELNGAHDPRVVHLGHIAFTHALVNYLFLTRFEGESAREMWRACQKPAVDDALAIAEAMGIGIPVSFVAKAIDFLRDHQIQHPEMYLDMKKDEHRHALETGNYERLVGLLNPKKNQAAWYLPSAINPIIEKAGFNVGRVWSDLDRLGCLVRQQKVVGRGSNGDRKVRRSFGRQSTRVYAISQWPELDDS